MSSSRKKGRASERRIAKLSKRTPVTVWTIVIIVLAAVAIGIARALR
ncbi:hypothetical protein ACFLXC_00670 [Chloroflexota bacterium]